MFESAAESMTSTRTNAGLFGSLRRWAPTNICSAVCGPSYLWHAFLSEWGEHKRQMKMFNSGSGNARWPEVFGTSPWWAEKTIWLLLFRISMAVTFLAFWTWSLVSSFQNFYWFIYLTHWSLTVEMLYFCFAAGTTFMAWKQLRNDSGGSRSDALPWFVRVTWLLLHIELPASLMVCFMYWTLENPIYNLQYVPDVKGVFVHGVNFLLCLADLLLGRNVFYLRYAPWFFVYTILYFLWSLIHYWAHIGTFGPCDEKSATGTYLPGYARDECPIYSVIDWHKPTTTGILCGILILVVVPLCHIPLWWCAKGRRGLDYLRHSDGGRDTHISTPLGDDGPLEHNANQVLTAWEF